MTVDVTVGGGTQPSVTIQNEQATVGVPAANGVIALNGLSGVVSLSVVGGSISAAGNTLTITVMPGVTSWNDLTDKPSTFPPSSHTHTASQITDCPSCSSSCWPGTPAWRGTRAPCLPEPAVARLSRNRASCSRRPTRCTRPLHAFNP